MKIFNIVCKVLLSLILLLPIMGALGIFPPATPDLYQTPEAFAFIEMLTEGGYIVYINAIVFMLALFLMWTKRMPLAMLLILPITVNVVAFHAFLDGGLLTGGAFLGNIMLVLNLYFMWQGREQYQSLLSKSI